MMIMIAVVTVVTITFLLIIICYLLTDKELEPFLDKIDEIEKSIAELEKAVIGLDEYTKRLEARYKKVMKSVK